jgi:hypothetical protein
MSDRHWHRPAVLVREVTQLGAVWYVYECECGKELPERRTPVAGISRKGQ